MQNSPPDSNAIVPGDPDMRGLAGGAAAVGRGAYDAAGMRETRRALAAAAVFLLFSLTVPYIPYDDMLTVVLSTLLSLVVSLLLTIFIARALRSRRAIWINVIVSGALVLPSVVIRILAARYPEWTIWARIAPEFRAYSIALFGTVPGLGYVLLIWFAAAFGALLGRVVREMKMLLPVAVALALVDLYVVYGGGAVYQARSGHSHVAAAAMQALAVRLPAKRVTTGASPLALQVGFADYLFIALFFSCLARFGVPSRSTAIVLCLTLAAYMAVVALAGLALPALVPMAAVLIGMNIRRFRYERSELFALLYAGLIVAGVLIALALRARA
jgi:hypothetical protein